MDATRDPLDRETKANSAVRGENDGAPLRRLVWERTRLARVVQKFCGPILIRNEVTERPAAPAVTKCPDFSGVRIGLTNQNAHLAAPLLGTSRRLALARKRDEAQAVECCHTPFDAPKKGSNLDEKCTKVAKW